MLPGNLLVRAISCKPPCYGRQLSNCGLSPAERRGMFAPMPTYYQGRTGLLCGPGCRGRCFPAAPCDGTHVLAEPVVIASLPCHSGASGSDFEQVSYASEIRMDGEATGTACNIELQLCAYLAHAVRKLARHGEQDTSKLVFQLLVAVGKHDAGRIRGGNVDVEDKHAAVRAAQSCDGARIGPRVSVGGVAIRDVDDHRRIAVRELR